MKRIALVTALALALTACGASAPPPAPVPPKPAIVALAHPPAAVAPAPAEAETRLIDHKLWSLTVPAGWTVVNDSEEGVSVNREKAPGVVPMSVQVVSQALEGMPPEVFVRIMSMMAEKQVPEGITVTDVQRQAGTFRGRPTSLTQVNTDKGVFLGLFCTVDVANNTGYGVVTIAPMTPEDSKLGAVITKTFTLKTPPPPETDEEAAPAPPPPAPKATPKKK